MAPQACNAIRLRIFRKARSVCLPTFQKSAKLTQPHRLCCDSNPPYLHNTNFLKKLRFVASDSSLTESITLENLNKALPDSNNNVRVSTSRAESKDVESLDSAIFATQKSNQYVGALAPTTSRPLRGVQSLRKGGSSASATIALEAEKARLSRQKIYFVAAEKTQRVASKAHQKLC